jgi:hypothetical protein
VKYLLDNHQDQEPDFPVVKVYTPQLMRLLDMYQTQGLVAQAESHIPQQKRLLGIH